MTEASTHPHDQWRGTFLKVDGVVQPGPAPPVERTPGETARSPSMPGEHAEAALADWGFEDTEIADLREVGVVA